jgi:hypothetical protein
MQALQAHQQQRASLVGGRRLVARPDVRAAAAVTIPEGFTKVRVVARRIMRLAPID